MVERFYGPLTGFEMRPGERGDYVRYSDYAALEAQLTEAREALAESDRQAEKLEALLDPHIAWEGKPAKAYAELTEALQKAEAQLAALSAENERLRKALDALDRMNRGLDWCDQDEQARRWSAARRVLTGGEF